MGRQSNVALTFVFALSIAAQHTVLAQPPNAGQPIKDAIDEAQRQMDAAANHLKDAFKTAAPIFIPPVTPLPIPTLAPTPMTIHVVLPVCSRPYFEPCSCAGLSTCLLKQSRPESSILCLFHPAPDFVVGN